jgi:hypothetical protein
MPFRNRLSRLAGFLGALLALVWAGCDVSSEGGRAFLVIRKDAAWDAFERLEISWHDSVSGSGATLFDGPPASLASVNRFQADGYHGQAIAIFFRGFRANALAFEEKRGFDGANPKVVTKEFTPIAPNPGPGPGGKLVPVLTGIKGGKAISIRDSLAFSANASIDGGSLSDFAWDCDGDGTYETSGSLSGATAKLECGHRFADTGRYLISLKVRSRDDTIAFASLLINVSLDAPTADAGQDKTVYPGDPVSLHGIASDGLGAIVRTEWKIGTGAFRPGSADTVLTAPGSPQDLAAVFRCVDDDSLTAVDTLTIHVLARGESYLSGLAASAGRLVPAFSPALTAYVDTVGPAVTGITFTPTGAGSLKVAGAVTASGTPSQSIPLKPGLNPVSVTVQAAGGAEKTYAVTVFRRSGSGNDRLLDMVVPNLTLEPPFSPAETAYTVHVRMSVSSAFVFGYLADSLASLKVKGVAAKSGTATGPLDLAIGDNPVDLEVMAENGSVMSYRINFIRAGDGIADLAKLSVQETGLSPRFDPETESYTGRTDGEGSSIHVLATPYDAGSSLTINGKGAANGAATEVGLSIGDNTIAIAVTAPGGAKRVYTLHINRPLNGNNYLSALSFSNLVLTGFSSSQSDYAVTVADTVTSTRLTATLENPAATLTINDKPAQSGIPVSFAIPFGRTEINVAVTALNGGTRTYLIDLNKAENGDATLSNLSISPGSLTPAFDPAGITYAATVPPATANVTITATTNHPSATVKVAGATAVSGAPASYPLGGWPTDFFIEVTAQNGTVKTYKLSVIR